MRKILQVLVTVGILAADVSYAQLRTIPANAKRATVGQPQVLPNVELDGKIVKLAPGGVIYDQNNRTIVHGALTTGAAVAVTPDLNGDISRIYVLTPQEQATLDRQK